MYPLLVSALTPTRRICHPVSWVCQHPLLGHPCCTRKLLTHGCYGLNMACPHKLTWRLRIWEDEACLACLAMSEVSVFALEDRLAVMS